MSKTRFTRRATLLGAAATLATLCAIPPALLGGAMVAQAYAPDALRFAVHAATGLGEEGLEAEEVQTTMVSLRNTMAWRPVKTAIAAETESTGMDETRIMAAR